MKRILFLLTVFLLLLPACTLAEDESEPHVFFREIFGIPEDPEDWKYEPLSIDPVACFGYVNYDHGLKGDQVYLMQTGRSAEDLAMYLRYLEQFGYFQENAAPVGDFESTLMTLWGSVRDATTYPPDVWVYHHPEHEMLVVTYDEDYSTVNRIWRSNAMTGNVSALPAEMTDRLGNIFTVEEVRNVHSLTITGNPDDLLLNYYADYLTGFDVLAFADGAGSGFISIHPVGDALNEPDDLLLVRISLSSIFDYATTYPYRQNFCIGERSAEDFCTLVMPVCAGTNLKVTNGHAVLQPITDKFPLDYWLVFRPDNLPVGAPLRLLVNADTGDYGYLPLDQWSHVDFLLPAKP